MGPEKGTGSATARARGTPVRRCAGPSPHCGLRGPTGRLVALAAVAAFHTGLYGLHDPVTATYALFAAVVTAGLSRIPGTGHQRAAVGVRALRAGWIPVTAGTLLAVHPRAAVAGMLVVGFLLPFAAVAGPRLAGAAPHLQLLYILPCFPAYAPQTLGKRLSGTTLGIVPRTHAPVVRIMLGSRGPARTCAPWPSAADSPMALKTWGPSSRGLPPAPCGCTHHGRTSRSAIRPGPHARPRVSPACSPKQSAQGAPGHRIGCAGCPRTGPLGTGDAVFSPLPKRHSKGTTDPGPCRSGDPCAGSAALPLVREALRDLGRERVFAAGPERAGPTTGHLGPGSQDCGRPSPPSATRGGLGKHLV